MSRVQPGVAVRGSTSGRPVMAAMDLLGRRWTLRILWELRNGPVGARGLLALCDGLSSSVLYERLRELTHAGLVEQYDDDSYGLTNLGEKLGTALKPLDAWSQQWAKQMDHAI
jgi:DNA-binding HxlR family transcriptional regulator